MPTNSDFEAVQPFRSVTVIVYVPVTSAVAVGVVCTGEVFQEYVYGPVPPDTIAAVAVPLFCNGQVASAEEAETTKTQGAAQLTAGWNPSLIIPPRSVPEVK